MHPTRKNTKRKLRQKTIKRKNVIESNYKHGIFMNSYISHAIHKHTESTGQTKFTYIYYMLRYCFTDISTEKCKEFAHILTNLVNKYKTDREITNSIYDFYKTLKNKNHIGFPISSNNYVKFKVSEISKTITPKLFDEQKHKVIVDVGAGDCALSYLIAESNQMYPVTVDIKSDVDWGSASSTSVCDKTHHIYYDGSNLHKAVRDEVGKKEIGIIMYNHSLHHFGSFKNITTSLEQAYSLLSKNGVLFLREHDISRTSDIDVNIQHIFLSLRYTMDHYNHWDKNKLWEYTENFIKTYSSHFFTKHELINLCKSIGFKLVDMKYRDMPYKYENYKEISQTMLLAFSK